MWKERKKRVSSTTGPVDGAYEATFCRKHQESVMYFTYSRDGAISHTDRIGTLMK